MFGGAQRVYAPPTRMLFRGTWTGEEHVLVFGSGFWGMGWGKGREAY